MRGKKTQNHRLQYKSQKFHNPCGQDKGSSFGCRTSRPGGERGDEDKSGFVNCLFSSDDHRLCFRARTKVRLTPKAFIVCPLKNIYFADEQKEKPNYYVRASFQKGFNLMKPQTPHFSIFFYKFIIIFPCTQVFVAFTTKSTYFLCTSCFAFVT